MNNQQQKSIDSPEHFLTPAKQAALFASQKNVEDAQFCATTRLHALVEILHDNLQLEQEEQTEGGKLTSHITINRYTYLGLASTMSALVQQMEYLTKVSCTIPR